MTAMTPTEATQAPATLDQPVLYADALKMKVLPRIIDLGRDEPTPSICLKREGEPDQVLVPELTATSLRMWMWYSQHSVNLRVKSGSSEDDAEALKMNQTADRYEIKMYQAVLPDLSDETIRGLSGAKQLALVRVINRLFNGDPAVDTVVDAEPTADAA